MRYYCTDEGCEKYRQKHCKVPKGIHKHGETPLKEERREILNCSCKNCEYDFSIPPCEWLGDAYNTDGDCLAQK